MKINILFATLDCGIEGIPNILLEPRDDLEYIISHQVTDEKYRSIPEGLVRKDVRVFQMDGRGLSRNRNRGLALADGEVIILADDDVRFEEAYINTVKETFASDSGLDVACFRIATPDGQPAYKDYAAKPYLLNEEEHHYISTLEITFRLKSVREANIYFDERFGLGSRLNSFGEEAVFIHDCIKEGLKVKYYPLDIVEHPVLSTTKGIGRYEKIQNIFKGAYDARRYGLIAFPGAFYGMLKIWPDLRSEGKNPICYLGERLKGAFYIYNEKRPSGPFA